MYHWRLLSFIALSLLLLTRVPGADSGSCERWGPGVAGWWPADGDTRNGLGTGRGRLLGNATYRAGVWGQAFSFSGGANRMEVGGQEALRLQDFTIEAWIKRASSLSVGGDAVGTILGGGGGSYHVGIAQEGHLMVGQVGTANVRSDTVVLDVDWHHIAVTKQGSVVRFFVDGAPAGESVLEATFSFDTPFAIGAFGQAFNGSYYGFAGLIDNLAVYRLALPPEQVAALARSTDPRCDDNVDVQISRSPIRVIRGSPFSVEAVVRNFSLQPVASARLQAWLPAGVTLVNAASSQGAVESGESPVVADLGILGPQQQAFLKLRLQSASTTTGPLKVQFRLAPMAEDPRTDDNAATAEISLIADCSETAADLAHRWPADGSTRDSVTGLEGEIQGAVQFVPGLVGSAFGFRENRALVNVGQLEALSRDFTIEGWIRRDSPSAVSPTSNHSFFLAGGIESLGFGLVPDGRLYLHRIGFESVFSGLTVTDTSWHHVAVTKAGPLVRFYVDGQDAGTAEYGVQFRADLAYSLGGSALADLNNGYGFLGDIDELSVTPRAVSSIEIAQAAASEGRCLSDLSVSMENPVVTVVSGEEFALRFLIEQLGEEASAAASFATILPPGLELVSATSSEGTCTALGGLVRCDFSSLDPQFEALVTLIVRPTAGRDPVISVQVQSVDGDPFPSNNVLSHQLTVVPFRLEVGDLVLKEGSGAGVADFAVFEIRSTPGRARPLDLGWGTVSGSAQAGQDFQPQVGEIALAPGQQLFRISVPVTADRSYERDEDFFLWVTNRSANPPVLIQARALIRNDDPAPVIRVEPVRVVEGNDDTRVLRWEARLVGLTDEPATLSIATRDGTARALTDFESVEGTLEFPPGISTRSIEVAVRGDTIPEGDEWFTLQLTDPVHCRLGSPLAAAFIDDDEDQGSVDHFEVMIEGGSLIPGQPTRVSVTARNAQGEVVPGFQGTLDLSVISGSARRSRVVLSEVGAASQPSQPQDFVELQNISPVDQDLGGWTLSIYGAASWPRAAVNLVIPSGAVLAPGTLTSVVPFGRDHGTIPDLYLGQGFPWGDEAATDLYGPAVVGVVLRDLGGAVEDAVFAGPIDPGFVVGTGDWQGPTLPTTSAPPYLWQRRGAVNQRAAGDWSAGLIPSPGATNEGMATLFRNAVSIRATPVSISRFVQGVWQGEVTLGESVSNASLTVDDGNGHRGSSAAFSSSSDADGDGLPDAWEQTHGLSGLDHEDATLDPDGDGVSSLDEYGAGTHPNDGTSVFKLLVLGDRLRFPGQAGFRYRLESREGLADATWQVLDSWTPAQSGAVEHPLSLGAEGRRFFRVVVEKL